MHLVLTTLTMLPHFTFALFITAPKQISGAYAFAYEQSLMQQRRRRLLSSPFPPYFCPTKCCRVWHKCWPTIVCQHLLVVCLRLKGPKGAHFPSQGAAAPAPPLNPPLVQRYQESPIDSWYLRGLWVKQDPFNGHNTVAIACMAQNLTQILILMFGKQFCDQMWLLTISIWRRPPFWNAVYQP